MPYSTSRCSCMVFLPLQPTLCLRSCSPQEARSLWVLDSPLSHLSRPLGWERESSDVLNDWPVERCYTTHPATLKFWLPDGERKDSITALGRAHSCSLSAFYWKAQGSLSRF
ncbi:hypothetical protein M405DRAFT_208317 [Rhizopogon salebrosus TDB-379]|nr:hypothetical protein M405DRAFT_208317 [Rhizopogon salebrosus TDB-379]